jgi:hypothetical protein
VREETDAPAQERTQPPCFSEREQTQPIESKRDVLDGVGLAQRESIDQYSFEGQRPQVTRRDRLAVRQPERAVGQAFDDFGPLLCRENANRPTRAEVDRDEGIGCRSQTQRRARTPELHHDRAVLDRGDPANAEVWIEPVGEVVAWTPLHVFDGNTDTIALPATHMEQMRQVFDNQHMRIMRIVAIIPVLSTVAVLTAADARRPTDAAADRVRAHIEFLSSDLLQGREPGTPGYEIAAEYVASQFRQLGLTAAGDTGSFFQRVPLLSYRLTDRGSFTLRGAGDRSIALAFGEEYLPGKIPVAGTRTVSAPLVFAGFGVVAPERQRDDYGDLDVKGKIVVVISGAPHDIPSEERAYYMSGRVKRAEAARRGAIGMVYVTTPEADQRDKFSDGARTWDSWSMTWRQGDGEPFDSVPTVPLLASLSSIAGEKLFQGAPKTFREVSTLAESKEVQNLPHFPLPWSLDARLSIEAKPSESRNIAGLIPGRDPVLKDEFVVLSAHLDHVGVTAPINGDSINNGALDNAAGVATTIEVARMMVTAERGPRRSVLLLAVTAEEKGLIGADYFARNPTVSRDRIVANVNLDMPILRYDFTDVVAFGAERSTIGDAVRRAARRTNLTLSPDPLPAEGLFVRSDHYRFVEAGVPAVFLMTGFANGGEKHFTEFLATCYHKPCDDTSQKLDYRAGAKFAQINYEIARELADATPRPSWKAGDFFGTRFGRPSPGSQR